MSRSYISLEVSYMRILQYNKHRTSFAVSILHYDYILINLHDRDDSEMITSKNARGYRLQKKKSLQIQKNRYYGTVKAEYE